MAENTTLFTVIAIIIIAIMIVGMMVSQGRYKALEARNNKIKLLTLQQRRLQNLLRSLPANYLSPELRDFLYQALLQNLKSHSDLVPDKNTLLKDDYQQLKTERERVKQNPPAPIDILMSADRVSIYRGLLKSLYQFIRSNYETGRLKKDHAEKMIKQIEIKLVETAVEFFTLTGKEFRQQGKFRQTRNALQKALDTIEESSYGPQFQQESFKIRSDLNRVIDDWHASRDLQSQASQGKLADEMTSMVDDQDSWKKKQTYE
ncbi:hypothetical protein [Reinekea sp.]|jgi:hypothetical protein|uniref:hypothetical protein n=1 Tax=Reinekea sp. TaxID=1970455 RepID=UPI002A803758|nr:hypothetical protein [Reinekea sp.]